MNDILSPVIGDCALVYIDDIIIYSRNTADHSRDIGRVLALIEKAGLKLNASKCQFGRESVDLLGFVISKDGISANPEKVTAIQELAPPTSVRGVRSFLGLANYYRQCVPGYAQIVEPLLALTRKNARFHWSCECQVAFEKLKRALVSKRVMAYPDPHRPYKLYTDACNYAIGGILVQVDQNGIERPIQYISHQLSSTQRKWATIEKEAYAVIYAITKLRTYLYGAEFTIYTDHKPLTSLFTKEMVNTKIQRWAVLIAEYGAKIKYRKGKNNIRADMLSRIESDRDEVAILADYDEQELNEVDEDCDWLRADQFDVPAIRASQRAEFPAQFDEAVEEEGEYTIIAGILYSERRPYPAAAVYPRVLLPRAWRQRVVERAHKEVGHMASSKTMKRVTEAYVWPGLRRDIRLAVRACPTCTVYNRRPVHVRMEEMPIPASPMEMIGMDFIGPFPVTDLGYRYAITIIDYHTGWAEVYPTRDQSAREIVRVFADEFMPRHGHPRLVINDNGQGFASKAWADFLQAADIRLSRTTPVRPQGNARVERFNRTFKELLNKSLLNQPNTWANRLPDVLSAYRHATSDVTGFTPFYLLYGRRERVPLPRLLSNERPFNNRLDDLANAYKEIAARTLESRKYNRERLNRKANVATSLDVGDSVVIKAEERLTNTTRWDPHWEVFRVRGPTHWVRNQRTGQTKTLHREKLTLVDPSITWDEIPPRPKRQYTPRPGSLRVLRQVKGNPTFFFK
jgi:transposase InsO family protein